MFVDPVPPLDETVGNGAAADGGGGAPGLMAQDWGPTFFSNIPADPGRHVCRFCIGMYVDHGFLTHECPDCGAPVPTKAESLYLHVWSRFNNVDRLVREFGLSWSALPRALRVETDYVAYLARESYSSKSYLPNQNLHFKLCQIYFRFLDTGEVSPCIDAQDFFETEVLDIHAMDDDQDFFETEVLDIHGCRDSEDSDYTILASHSGIAMTRFCGEEHADYTDTGDRDSEDSETESERAYSETGDTDSDNCFTESERAAFKAECSGRKHGTCAKMCCEACTRDPHA